MPTCERCTSSVNAKSPGLQCIGRCQKFYHGKCVGLSKQDVSNFLVPGAYWACPDCRDKTNERSSVITMEGNEKDEADSVPLSVTLILKDIQLNLKSLNNKYEDVMESVNFCSNQISTFEKAMNQLNEKIATIEKINRENVNLKSELTRLTTKVDILEQQTRSNNIEIQGVPQKSNENLVNILAKIGEHIQCPILPQDVDTVHRVAQHPSSDQQQPKSIVVKFLSKLKRDSILAATKNIRRAKNDTNSPGIVIENISNKLFINEHLTNKLKLLLKNTKQAAKSNNYKFVWKKPKENSEDKPFTKYSAAKMILLQGEVRLVPEDQVFIISKEKQTYLVTLLPKENCSCKAKKKCHHMEAAYLAIGNIREEQRNVKLSKIVKRKREYRAGRKHGPGNMTVVEAANDSLMKSRSDDIKNSTTLFIPTVSADVQGLKQDVTYLKNEYATIRTEIETLQQQGRNNNLEICGVPEMPNENTLRLITSIFSKMGVNFSDGDIEECHRVKSFPNPNNENKNQIKSLQFGAFFDKKPNIAGFILFLPKPPTTQPKAPHSGELWAKIQNKDTRNVKIGSSKYLPRVALKLFTRIESEHSNRGLCVHHHPPSKQTANRVKQILAGTFHRGHTYELHEEAIVNYI
ncbi:unnamed protein product [Phaedon cochleariae]|uniref:PHD-type domain-containing protein n=1 Tax=Phaedon cochleariae TaxID=80249 RepID=A0A9N9SD01_PHACE|nr:unnamed protein product [Phaedon cochleariae]